MYTTTNRFHGAEAGPTPGESEIPYVRVFEETLAYARRRKYTGPDYCDGMSSKILQALPVDNKWLNLVFQESVKRAPVNIRPLLLVEERPNYKGMALFSMANLTAHELLGDASSLEPAVGYRDEARRLADWLVDNQSTGYSGFCGGHQHTMQTLNGKGLPNKADAVSTSYAVKALLRAGTIDPEYARIAKTAADFIVDDLNYREVEEGAKIDYYRGHPEDSYTTNAGAIAARALIDLYDHFGDEYLIEHARNVLDHVAANQTDIGGWTYRIPPSSSHLSMDNHHNGFIIEVFQRYREVTGSDRYDRTLRDALWFYRNVLFDADGAPNFDERSAYPRDIHASTQGILVFTYDEDFEFARQILDWVLDNLYAGNGKFYYRKQRYYTKRITLMRWCQAWMAYAMSEYLRAIEDRVLDGV